MCLSEEKHYQVLRLLMRKCRPGHIFSDAQHLSSAHQPSAFKQHLKKELPRTSRVSGAGEVNCLYPPDPACVDDM